MSEEFKRIKRKFNTLHKNWAVSGSWAMKLYGNMVGIKTRNPNDFDFVVQPKDASLFINALDELGYTYKGPPPVQFRHLKLKKGKYEIDLLGAGGNLAPYLNKVTMFNSTTPLIPIRALVKQKQVTNNWNNTPSANLPILMKLQNALK